VSKKLRILHIINSFEFGGAEVMLCNLILRTDRTRFEPFVAALIDVMSAAAPLKQAGIPIVAMGMKPGVPDPRGVARLARHIRRIRPDVIQCWMDHSNLIGGLAAHFASSAPVLWGIHHSNHVRELTKRTTLLTLGACAFLSKRIPAKIVYCSEHARKLYAQRGFAAENAVTIPNGFDTARFRPDPDARLSVREELRLDPATPLVGLAARFDPFKDHANFVRAAAIVSKNHPHAHFLLCGARVDAKNQQLTSLIESSGVANRCHLLGPRRDVPRLFAALDVAASSSISEAFPLAIGEAMACGVPCAATDVGDSALIIGQTGKIVPARNSEALAKAFDELLSLTTEARESLGRGARQRVCELFDLNAVCARYHELYDHVVRERSAAMKIPAAQAVSPTSKLASPSTAFRQGVCLV
jgi:glycosyltransferase involved in cell wall biosynthesis